MIPTPKSTMLLCHSAKMIQNKFGELVYNETDVFDLLMQGRELGGLTRLTVDSTVDIEKIIYLVEDPGSLLTWTFPSDSDKSVPEFDAACQSNWHMPQGYRDMDIAAYVLDLCDTQEKLQRVGHELLMFQDRDLMDLLKYLKYLVDTLKSNNVIWGVGRGSSVASYVLYLLEVHKIDSMHYDLDPEEFLR